MLIIIKVSSWYNQVEVLFTFIKMHNEHGSKIPLKSKYKKQLNITILEDEALPSLSQYLDLKLLF